MLALRMGRTVDELKRSMSSQEFSMWTTLYSEDRWGDLEHDFRTGLLCATIGNFAGKSLTPRAPPLKPSDFMPGLDKPVEAVEPDPVMFFTAIAVSKTFNK